MVEVPGNVRRSKVSHEYSRICFSNKQHLHYMFMTWNKLYLKNINLGNLYFTPQNLPSQPGKYCYTETTFTFKQPEEVWVWEIDGSYLQFFSGRPLKEKY